MDHNSIFARPSVMALLQRASTVPEGHRLDDASTAMVENTGSAYAMQDISLRAAAAVQEWAETKESDLGEGEGMGDRLLAMLVGIADEDQDGELDEDEQAVAEVAMNEAWAYMESLGAAEADLESLFNSEVAAESNTAAGRLAEFLADALPSDEDASLDELDAFAFGADQSGIFDAVYKKKLVVRGAKKVRVMKRVSGVVRLSGPQKVALRKARNKSHSAKATMRRAKSMRVREAANL
jgi:hypothetical protein